MNFEVFNQLKNNKKMRVAITGWNGFLASKLRENNNIEWTENFSNTDTLVLMGSPTFTGTELSVHDSQVMHQYVRETIKIVDRYSGNIIFASTTGVDDIQLDHQGSTSYNLAKLYLENYIINNADSWAILRIGTIVSKKFSDVQLMKSDRIQSKIINGNLKGIPMLDNYLDIDTFVDSTINLILNFRSGIHEYKLTQYTLPKLALLAKTV